MDGTMNNMWRAEVFLQKYQISSTKLSLKQNHLNTNVNEKLTEIFLFVCCR